MSFQDVLSHGIIPKDQSRRDNFHFNGTHSTGIFTASYSLNYTVTNTSTTALDQTPFQWGTLPGTIAIGSFGTATGGSYFQKEAAVLEYHKPASEYQFPELQELADRSVC